MIPSGLSCLHVKSTTPSGLCYVLKWSVHMLCIIMLVCTKLLVNFKDYVQYRKQRKFGVAKIWRIWQIDKIWQTFIRQLTMRPRDIY